MGDGNITCIKPEVDAKECKSADVAALSGVEDYEAKECDSFVPPLPLELEEIHRNANDTVNSPDISNASIQSPTSEKQAAGTPRRGGRRNFRVGMQASDSEYGLPLGPAAGLGPQESINIDGNQEIFSVRGTRSLKISRHRDNVTVFPSGCMGIMEEDLVVPPEVATPAPVPVVAESPSSTPSRTNTDNCPLGRPNSGSRNPLTGEGYKNQAFRQSPNKKKDGNPVLGQGYEETAIRTKKVPPGGFCHDLW